MNLKFLNLTNLLILFTFLGAWYLTTSVISPYLHYSYQQIGFLTSFDFFKSFLYYPGGIADYVSGFISQFFCFNTLGSFLIVSIALLQGILAISILKKLSIRINFNYAVVASTLLFGIVLLCDYRYPYYASIRLLFAFIFTWLFVILNSKQIRYGAFLWPVLACLLFYLANGAALIVFTASTAIICGFKNKLRLAFVPVYVILGALIPYIGYKFIFQITLLNVYNITLVKPPVQLAYTQVYPLYIYYALLPAFLLIFFAYERLRKPLAASEPPSKPRKGHKAEQEYKIKFYKTAPFLLSLQVIVICSVGYLLFLKFEDSYKKKLILIEYYAENEDWPEVLKLAESIEKYDFRVNFQVNRAYSHLGFLPDRLFAYPQLLGVYGLFIDPSMMVGSSDMPTSDLYFDLGFMNESQHWAFEAETLLPNSPRILKRLVMINLVNRKYKLAGEFLNVLSKNRLCSDWVHKYEKYVADTTLAASDQVIAEKRRFAPKKALVNVGVLEGLKLLFETNPDNRMAYDYLLAYFILDTRLPEFVEYLKYYKHYNLKSLPKSWEEALSIYILKTRSFPDFVTEETISKNGMQRLGRFNELMKGYKNDLPAAKNAVSQEFGESFWYYMLYLSPKVTNVLNNKTQIR